MEGKTKKRLRAKPKNIIIIALIVCGILAFGKITNLTGKFTGTTADDGSSIFRRAADWEGNVEQVKLTGTEEMVWIPVKSDFSFDSEETAQVLDIGNSEKNTLPMKISMKIGKDTVFETGILEPGKGMQDPELGVVFSPNTYQATLVYTFYKTEGSTFKKLKTYGTVEKEVEVVAEGSGKKYQTNVDKAKKK